MDSYFRNSVIHAPLQQLASLYKYLPSSAALCKPLTPDRAVYAMWVQRTKTQASFILFIVAFSAGLESVYK